MKKKKNFLNGFTPLQKTWIYVLLCVLVVSICLTVLQLFKVLSPKKEKKKTSVVSIVQPVSDEDPTVLKVSEDAGKEYVDNTLFLGDSNTVRFMDFTDNEGNTYTTKKNTIAVVGMGVQAIDSLECMEFSTGTFTMTKSVSILQPERIIITFGTNNLTGSDTKEAREAFITDYEKQLQEIHDAYDKADLIINSIPPISEYTIYKNLDALEIKHWNEAIMQMCEKNGWHYLDSYSSLADEKTGYALEDMMDTDGLHLSKKGIHTLFSYIRTHASPTIVNRGEVRDIPEIIGPKTDLYTVNPLSGESFDESVLHPTDPTPIPATEDPQVPAEPSQDTTTNADQPASDQQQGQEEQGQQGAQENPPENTSTDDSQTPAEPSTEPTIEQTQTQE